MAAASATKVQHLCAICAEKAVSKCGRCQKVWYCGRKHQAEHWKSHKQTCAGGPPEPKPKVEVEADACMVAVVTANLFSDADATALTSCLVSLRNQVEPLEAIYLSWYAETQSLAEQVTCQLDGKPQVVAAQCSSSLERFEHIKSISGKLQCSAPAHSWIVIVDGTEIWNPRCTSLLLPGLRRAATDQRIIAACCRSRASTGEEVLNNADEVDAALKKGSAELCTNSSTPLPEIHDIAVKVKTLLAFLDSTPAGMLAHELCTYRLLYKMSHTFGKKVQDITLPADDATWLRWVAANSFRRPNQAEKATEEVLLTTLERERGHELYDNLKTSGRFESPDVPTSLIAKLRQGVLRRMAQWAGETVNSKEIRTIATELATTFIDENDLTAVLGLQRWVRDVAIEVAEATAQEFSVKLSE